MRQRASKWYRSEKRLLRPFGQRLWGGITPMRGNRHQCKCAQAAIWMKGGRDVWEKWPDLFEPVRVRKKVYRERRPSPFWSRKGVSEEAPPEA